MLEGKLGNPVENLYLRNSGKMNILLNLILDSRFKIHNLKLDLQNLI